MPALALSSVAQSLVRDASRTWNNGSQQPTVVTFSFDTLGGGFISASSSRSGTAMPDSLKASARMALDAWASVSGLHFVEVPDTVNGTGIDLRIRLGTLSDGSDYEATSPAGGGDITWNASFAGRSSAPGGYIYEDMLLTVGYALGMKDLGSSYAAQSAMAAFSDGNSYSTRLEAADVEAIQYTYGTQQAEDALHIRWSWDAGQKAVLHQGDDSAQVMNGTALRDIILGYGGNDAIKAGDGDDLINAGTGNNTASGGSGRDTLRTDVFRHQVSLTELRHNAEDSDNHDSLSGLLARPSEETRFSGIETIAFTDGRLVFDGNEPVAQVMRMYQAALGRQPEAAGKEYWIAKLSSGTPLPELARSFLDSPEFLARFGQPDDDGFIATAYRQSFGREADAGGMAYWKAQLASGTTRADLLTGFSESPENRALTAPLLAKGLWDADDQLANIARIYKAVLGRTPEIDGLRYWDQQADAGASESQMANHFASSPEFNSRFPGASDVDFVAMVYQNTLGRGPDPAGQTFWLDHLSHGLTRGEMVAGVTHSDEFLTLSAGLTEGGIVFA